MLCAKHTRVEIQAQIMEWVSSQHSTDERIFWITGIAGSGKSTLSATVVDTLRKKDTPVAAQFFISRNIPETINPNKVIPTIAKQLSEFSPAAACIIHDTLKKGFPSSLKEQVEALLLAPIQEICKSYDRLVILIDALDELESAADSVPEILQQIAPLGYNLPTNFRFIITSRPEQWADISSSKTLELAVFKQHPLTTESSMAEVHTFIITRMKEITPKGQDWVGWPTDDQLLKLSENASGLFHYAATALQWIKEQIKKHNKSCRSWVFDQLTQMGGVDALEDLYRLVLTSFEDIDRPARDKRLHEDRLRGFQQVIGTILVLHEPLTIRQITALLADIPEDDFDVTHFLEQFRSVLIPSTTAAFKEAIPQMHKSFRDYIMNAAPPEFRIHTGKAQFVTARSCLEIIVKARSPSDVVAKYSVQHWYKHLRKAVEEEATCEDERMWELFGRMVEEAVVGIWATSDLIDLFVDVATVGWGLLKRDTEKHRVERISFILRKAKERVHAFPPSPMFVLLTFSPLLVSRLCVVRAFPHVCLA
ncbi:hypothetical protein K438DRAFT_1011396, partial [Mycena galopus ATCC 62051]